jgi:predicted nucleotidyltransferase
MYVPKAIVWAYGSRTKSQAHQGSDLDLVIIFPEPTMALKQLPLLREAIKESDLSILVDILDWDTLPSAFQEEIKTHHVILKYDQII